MQPAPSRISIHGAPNAAARRTSSFRGEARPDKETRACARIPEPTQDPERQSGETTQNLYGTGVQTAPGKGAYVRSL